MATVSEGLRSPGGVLSLLTHGRSTVDVASIRAVGPSGFEAQRPGRRAGLLARGGVQRITAIVQEEAMLTLYSYPALFGVADNNGYGLKVFAFLKLAGLPFRHTHILDASSAPRAQLPYIIDGDDAVGDSDRIIAHLTHRYGLTIDAGLKPGHRQMGPLVSR